MDKEMKQARKVSADFIMMILKFEKYNLKTFLQDHINMEQNKP
jgi:hypothetical protein